MFPAHAAPDPAPPRCQGRRATLVGNPGTKHLMGTTGADVVVTGGAPRVETDDGDESLCLQAYPRRQAMSVHAGAETTQ